MTKKAAETEQVTFRVPSSWVRTAEVLAAKVGETGLTISRTDILRLALYGGLCELRAGAMKGPHEDMEPERNDDRDG